MKIKRLIYLGYYLKKLDWKLFRKFMSYTKANTGRSGISIWWRIIRSIFKYNISILEYYQFRFFEKTHFEKLAWAGTGFMYEFQLRMNPRSERHILDDKRLFYKAYKDYILHTIADVNDLESDKQIVDRLLTNTSGKIVFKGADGKCGAEVAIYEVGDFTEGTLLEYIKKSPYDLVEAFLIQHPDLNRLSPSAVNTVRIFTQLNADDQVDILGCRLRISVNSHIDNLAAGNIAAPIDEATGIVNGPGVYSDITKAPEDKHPVTGVPIPGFQVPFWPEIMAMVKEAALLHPQNRSIGWDVVVTEQGPGLIEGNHDWCKLLWQLPEGKGLKERLMGY